MWRKSWTFRTAPAQVLSMKLKTVIIDQDRTASASLDALLNQLPDVQLLQTFESSSEASTHLKNAKVDLVFFDAFELRDVDEQFLNSLSRPPQVILTTANDGLIIDPVEFDLTDVLLKPYALPQLSYAINKVAQSQKALSKVALDSEAKEIYIKEDGRLVRIPIDDIYYFENAGDYVKVITKKRSHIIAGALKNIANRLKNPRLLKIHRSFIVHLNKIVDIEDHSIELENGKVVPISRAHKPALIKSLNII